MHNARPKGEDEKEGARFEAILQRASFHSKEAHSGWKVLPV